MSDKKTFADLQKDIVDAGLCTSCGSCKGVCIADCIKLGGDEWEPELAGECTKCGLCYEVCPGKDIPMPAMEEMMYGRRRNEENAHEYWLGIYRDSFAGHATDETLRKNGASGGLTTALLICALKEKYVDAVIVAGMDKEQPWRTATYLTSDIDTVIAAQQSKYASVPMNAALQELYHRDDIQSVAIVALPCQLHALRKMELNKRPAKLLKKVKLTIGLFCAAQLYYRGTVHLAKEWCGVDNMEDIVSLEYRGGDWPGSFIIKTKDGQVHSIPQHDYKYHHLIPFYQRDRCMMCIDYAADLADISLGDIWKLAKKGEFGWNAGLTRTDRGQELMKLAEEKGYIVTKELDPDMILTGTIGLEEKRHGNSLRFAGRIKHGWPTPNFGYEPTGHLHPFGDKPTHSS